MTSSTLGDDARGAGLGGTRSFSIIRMVYHVSVHNVNPGGMIADKVLGQKKGRSLGAIILCLGHVLILTDTWAFTLV
jgi:POT family proton-dependent oligopeptide transporter